MLYSSYCVYPRHTLRGLHSRRCFVPGECPRGVSARACRAQRFDNETSERKYDGGGAVCPPLLAASLRASLYYYYYQTEYCNGGLPPSRLLDFGAAGLGRRPPASVGLLSTLQYCSCSTVLVCIMYREAPNHVRPTIPRILSLPFPFYSCVVVLHLSGDV